MIAKCPNCTWSDEVEDEFLGQQAECPSCENDFIVKKTEALTNTPNKLNLDKPPKTNISAPITHRPANTEHNPYSAPRSATAPSRSSTADKEYPGFGRLIYFGLYILLIFIAIIPIIGIIITIIGLVYIIAQRLRNVGYSAWLTILLIVPLANMVLGIICIAAPEGYADHKKLDTPGRIIAGLFLGLFALAIIGFIIRR